jgi:hypothetical protein
MQRARWLAMGTVEVMAVPQRRQRSQGTVKLVDGAGTARLYLPRMFGARKSVATVIGVRYVCLKTR